MVWSRSRLVSALRPNVPVSSNAIWKWRSFAIVDSPWRLQLMTLWWRLADVSNCETFRLAHVSAVNANVSVSSRSWELTSRTQYWAKVPGIETESFNDHYGNIIIIIIIIISSLKMKCRMKNEWGDLECLFYSLSKSYSWWRLFHRHWRIWTRWGWMIEWKWRWGEDR